MGMPVLWSAGPGGPLASAVLTLWADGHNPNGSSCQASNTREARSKRPSVPPPVRVSWGQVQVPAGGGQVGKPRQVAVTARSRVNVSGVERRGGGWEVSPADPGCWRGYRCLASHGTPGKQGSQTQTPTLRRPRAGGKASGESGVCLGTGWASSLPAMGTQAGSKPAPHSPGF